MKDEYFVINRKVLPDYFEKVIEIKDLISRGENISLACKKVGLSRSTFYKYKDYVNHPTLEIGKRIILSLKVKDEMGVLSNILNQIANAKANVLTIHQEMPVHNIAYITMTIALRNVDIPIQKLVIDIKSLSNVFDVELLAVE